MKSRRLIPTYIIIVALIVSSLVYGGTDHFDKSMAPLLEEYLKIHDALAADKTDGVKGAAEQIVTLSDKVDPNTVTGEHKEHYRHLPMTIKKAAQKLARGKDLGAAREAFKELSRPVAMWATMSKPKGVYVIYCSMASGSWLQKDKAIRNPYHGSQMLRCGEIVGGEDHDKGAHGQH
ncbi:MAG: DUF3347 domain-containing protein [Thermodesulfobacteriota bacterium]|nr:DUF3347 domain-containing protein [Thermodesulfobacteriota bacterium]